MTSFITTHVKSAYLKCESKHELYYIIPFEEVKKGNAENLFQALESSLNQLHISSFGIMDTTLEEVFLKVTEWFHCSEGNLQIKFLFISLSFEIQLKFLTYKNKVLWLSKFL